MSSLDVRARRLVTPAGERPGTLRVRDGRVVAIDGYDDASDAALLDVPDELAVLPGLVDTHVHLQDPGHTSWEDFPSATAAAARGGITTLVDMPLDCLPVTTDVAALSVKRTAAQGRCAVDVGFWGGAVPANAGDLRPLWDAGVLGFKAYLAPTGLAEFPPLTPDGLDAALSSAAALGATVLVHAELARPVPSTRSYATFLDARSDTTETAAVDLVLATAARTGAAVHIVHVSSARVVEQVVAARAAGVRATAETCPHYLVLAAEEVPDGGTEFTVLPPIRRRANADALWEALRAGAIDLVVSDHSPREPRCGHDPDFATGGAGIASLQLSLPLVWTEARRRGLSLDRVAAWMADGPARFAGLAAKGGLRPGADADFSLFGPDEQFVVDPADLLHKQRSTPYAGRRLHGVVHGTWLRGRPVGPGTAAGRLLGRAA